MMSRLEHRTTASNIRLITTAFGLSLLELGTSLPVAGAAWETPGFDTLHANAINQPALAQSLDEFREISFRPPTPPDVGSPRERRGAASRGSTRDPREGCPVISGPTITALVPAYDQDKFIVDEVPLPGVFEGNHSLYGSTVEPYPTLWLYLPYGLTPNRPGELRTEVVGDDGVPIQQTLMTYTDAPAGVVGIPLAGTELAPLEIGEWRDLLFVLRCDLNDPAQNLTVGFTVQRVEPLVPLANATSDLTAEPGENAADPSWDNATESFVDNAVTLPLDTVTTTPSSVAETADVPPPVVETVTPSQEQAAALAEAGIWYDLLTTLAALRRENPENPDFADNWSNLLKSVGLADVADQALSDCCTVPNDAVADDETSSE